MPKFKAQQRITIVISSITMVTVVFLLFNFGYAYGQSNNTETNARSYMNCFNGTMTTFLLQVMFSPPEIKSNISDLTSPEVKQYVSDACNFYHNKSGIWLSGTDDAHRDQAYIQLNKTK